MIIRKINSILKNFNQKQRRRSICQVLLAQKSWTWDLFHFSPIPCNQNPIPLPFSLGNNIQDCDVCISKLEDNGFCSCLQNDCNHHCARLEFGNFWESSPKFFSARVKGVLPLLGAFGSQKLVLARRRGVVYEKILKNWKFLKYFDLEMQ